MKNTYLDNGIATFLSFEEIEQHMNDCADFGEAMMMVGPPGCGKSERTAQFAKKRNADYITRPCQTMTVEGLTCYLFIDREDKRFVPFYSELGEKLLNAKRETIVHLQDALLAKPEVRDCLMSLVQLREIEGRKISKHIRFVLDTNENSHGAGRGQTNTALNNRISIFNGMPNDIEKVADYWIREYAIPNGIAKEIILFIMSHKHFAYIQGDIPKGGFTQFHTLRTWAKLSPYVQRGRMNVATIQSIIGNQDNVAFEFFNFWKNLEKFGGLLNEIKKDPLSARVFTAPQDIFTIASMLACNVDKKTIDSYAKYMSRSGNREFRSVMFEFGAQFNPDVKETVAYTEFLNENRGS